MSVPVMNVALIAAAANRAAVHKGLLQRLEQARAFGPADAIPLDATNEAEGSALTELIGTTVIRKWGSRYYLDRDRQKARESEQLRVLAIVMVGLLSILASGLALLTFN